MQAEPDSESATGTAIRTFLIADVRGYTLFTAERGDEAAARLASRFAALAREGVETSGGAVIELRGDEALAVFDSPRQAIRAAVRLQRRFVDETVEDPTLPLAVGIGLDAGEAVPVEEGYRGGALNLAARLCSLAGPAEILASREVVHLARKVEGVAYVDRGTVTLKGITDPVQVIRLRAEAEDAAEDMAFRRALGPQAARLAPAVPGAIARNPYKGLRPFEESDAADFFGRESLIELLVNRLGNSRFLAVVGPSGSGKSSVVRAGLIPALRRGALRDSGEWRIAEMYPGPRPLEELEAALLRIAENPPASLIEQLKSDDHGLLRAVKRALPADGSELLLLIDQFEEVFTLVEDEAARTHFLESLEAAVTDPRGRLRVVITLRADFYDRPLLYRGFAELLRSRVEAVVPLSPEEVERAISGPASRVDVRLEPGLAAKMVADVADEPGGLPLLQYALTELFERREGTMMTLDSYRAIGGVSGALGRRAEELFQDLDPHGEEAARQIVLRLVTLGEGTEDTRRPVPRSELFSLDIDEKAMTAVIDTFGAARLLSFDRDFRTGVATVEVAHEALLTAWTRLRRWIDEAREDLRTERRLAAAARDWVEAGRDPSFLAGGSRLEQFETWRQGSRISITPEEREFLEASLAERDRLREEEETRQARERALERRSVRRLRAVVAVLTAAALIAAGLTVFAFNQRERAEREGRVAVARELAAAADASLEVDPERSILLALEAVRRTRSADGSVLPEAEEALHRALVASRIELSVPGLGGSVDWSPDGTMFVTEGPEETGVIDVRDADTGRRLRKFQGHDVDVNDVAFSPDSSMLATTGDDGSAKVWNPATGEQLWDFRGSEPEDIVFGPSFSPDGSLLAAAWPREGTVRLFDLSSGRQVREITPAAGFPRWETAFSTDGKRLAIAMDEPPAALVVDVRSGKTEFTVGGHEFGVQDVDWSPNGRWLATSSLDSTARIWDARTGRPLFRLSGHSAQLVASAWSPDSTRLATGSADGTTKVWEVTEEGAEELFVLSGKDTVGGNIPVFSPDGTRVMTGDAGIRAVKVWDVSRTGDAEWSNFPVDPTEIPGIAFAPDGSGVVASNGDGSMTVWDPASGEEIRTLGASLSSDAPQAPYPLWDIDVSPDGRLIATTGEFETNVRDARAGAEVFSLVGPPAESVAWSPDGNALAAGIPEASHAKIVDRTGKTVALLQEDPVFAVAPVAFSRNGRLVATGLWPPPGGRVHPTAFKVRIWDWEREEIVRTIDTEASTLAFDPTGKLLGTGGFLSGLAEIWEVETGRKVATLTGHGGAINDMEFSPDGTVVATASDDGTVRLWDPQTGVERFELRGREGIVWHLAFSPDGSQLVSSSLGQARVWAVNLDDLIDLAEGELTRGLTNEECRQYLHVDRCPEK